MSRVTPKPRYSGSTFIMREVVLSHNREKGMNTVIGSYNIGQQTDNIETLLETTPEHLMSSAYAGFTDKTGVKLKCATAMVNIAHLNGIPAMDIKVDDVAAFCLLSRILNENVIIHESCGERLASAAEQARNLYCFGANAAMIHPSKVIKRRNRIYGYDSMSRKETQFLTLAGLSREFRGHIRTTETGTRSIKENYTT